MIKLCDRFSMNILIPADVPPNKHATFEKNYEAITRATGNLFLFAGDQKIEHLNKDFYGEGIADQANNPQHMFEIAAASPVGAFATHLGLIARYGKQYPSVNYIAKLNGKTDVIRPCKKMSWWQEMMMGRGYTEVVTTQALLKDPLSTQLWSVEDVITIKQDTGLNICGIGFTLYLGSFYEQTMLAQAAQMIYQAHQQGLIAIAWIYPRGQAVTDDQHPDLVAGATGIAACLGADFVKIKQPTTVHDLTIACLAAGTTQVICAGGKAIDPHQLLQNVFDQLRAGSSGCAIGRNIFQKNISQATRLAKALAALIYDKSSVQQAIKIYEQV